VPSAGALGAGEAEHDGAGLIGVFGQNELAAGAAVALGAAGDGGGLPRRREFRNCVVIWPPGSEKVIAQLASGGSRLVTVQTPPSCPNVRAGGVDQRVVEGQKVAEARPGRGQVEGRVVEADAVPQRVAVGGAGGERGRRTRDEADRGDRERGAGAAGARHAGPFVDLDEPSVLSADRRRARRRRQAPARVPGSVMDVHDMGRGARGGASCGPTLMIRATPSIAALAASRRQPRRFDRAASSLDGTRAAC